MRTCVSELLVGGHGWHVGEWPCTEGEGRLASAVGFHRSWTESNQRGEARIRRKRACCASSRERDRTRWRFILRTCVRKLLVGRRGWPVRARPCTEGEGRLAGAVGFHWLGKNFNQRSAARARHKPASYASSRERQRAVAQHLTHNSKKAACWRPRLTHLRMAVHQGRGPSRWHSGLS